MKKAIPILIAAFVVVSFLSGCSKEPVSSGSGSFGATFGFAGSEAPSPGSIGPNWTRTPGHVEPYQVADDLGNIVNLDQFDLPEAAKEMLTKNLFFARPTDNIQLFHILDGNQYNVPRVPTFIAADTVLQTYHIFFDYTLRIVEDQSLYGELEKLTGAMLRAAVRQREEVAGDPVLAKAADRNVVFFLVPTMLLEMKTPDGVKPEDTQKAEEEIAKIEAHSGRERMTIFPYMIDYSQFNPRGHYTRNEKFKRFFGAMMWYGLVPFAVAPDAFTGTTTTEDVILSFMLITLAWNDTTVDGRKARDLWESIYEPTAFYVGFADDLTGDECLQEMHKAYGDNVRATQLADEAAFGTFMKGVSKLREPQIKVKLLGIPGEKQFRFMGQRYIPDSEILQDLAEHPSGLTVMSVLGSQRAEDLFASTLDEAMAQGFRGAVKMKADKFAALPPETWASNVYWSWIDSLTRLYGEFPEGYPSFMLKPAWQDKSLLTACASWAELRHDTILYAKQSGMECGDGEEPPPVPKGYVEPNVELYQRLVYLTSQSRGGLKERGFLTSELESLFGRFEDMLVFLRDVSIKELNNETLSQQEYDQIMVFGGQLELLTISIAGGEILSETDKDMAVIADVHTSFSSCLEEGVGHAAEIYVVVPIEGKLYLTRGAMFTYYEFWQPVSDRLTDEKWQKMLSDKTAPPMPDWTKSFMLPETEKVDIRRKGFYSTGC